MDKKLRIGVLISGSGTNLQEIIDRTLAGTLDAEIVTVISNKPDVKGLQRAADAGIRHVVIMPENYNLVANFNQAIARELSHSNAEYVILAGYMKLVGREVLEAYPNKVVNLHPAILPSFPGAHGIQEAFDYGVKVSGITVHFANEVFDEGPIIAQQEVQIAEDDTVETFEAKIHAAEYQLLPAVIQMIAEGRVHVQGRKVVIDG